MLIDAACRGFLFVVFAAAVIGKVGTAARRRAFAAAVAGFGVPRPWSDPVAAAVVAGELGLLVLLVAEPTLGYAAAAALLAVFTAAMGRVVWTGARVACRCFGGSAAAVGAAQVVRNALLFAAAGLAALAAPGASAASTGTAGWWLATVGGCVAGAVVTRWDDVVYVLGFGQISGSGGLS